MFGIISCKATWSWIFVCREFFVFVFFNYRFYFTSSDQSVQFIFSQFSFGGLYLSFGGLYLCPFLLSCQICWLIIVHSILLRFFLFLQYQLKFLLFHFLIYLDSIFVLLGETGQRFVNFVYPFKDPVLDFTDFFFWPCWVFVLHGLSVVLASGDYFSSSAQASHWNGFSCFGARAPRHSGLQ